MVSAHPAGDEGDKRQPEQQMEVGQENSPVDPAGELQQVMVVVQIDAQEHEAKDKGQKPGHEGIESPPVGTKGHLQLEDHDRHQDRDDAIAERFETAFAHFVPFVRTSTEMSTSSYRHSVVTSLRHNGTRGICGSANRAHRRAEKLREHRWTSAAAAWRDPAAARDRYF